MQSDLISSKHSSICYIVPNYTKGDASHMAHIPRFLSELGKYCDVYIIIQRGIECPDIPNVKSIYMQCPGNHFKRAIELIKHAYHLSRSGCRKFFIRISPSAAFELGIISKLLNIQVYYWVSGQSKRIKPSWNRSFYKRAIIEISQLLQRINFNLAFRFVTGPENMVSYYEKEHRVNPRKIILLYNDIDIASINELRSKHNKFSCKSSLKFENETEIVLFVGRVSLLKGGYNLIPLAKKMLIKRPNAKLIVVGDYDHLPDIRNKAQLLGLENLMFAGSVANCELYRYYLAADVFILPSESEGFPRVLLEAMAYGVPVVAFDVGGARDIMHQEQLSFMIQRGDVEGMTEKITALLDDPVLRDQQVEFGLDKVKQYSTEIVAKMFFERIVLN